MNDVESQRDNLAMLVRRLCRKLQDDATVKVQALDYLRRMNLQGNIMRDDAAPQMTAGEFAGLVIDKADEWCLRQVSAIVRTVAAEHNIAIVEPQQ